MRPAGRRLLTLFATLLALVALTTWLIVLGTRGAEIANVLALPLAVVSTVVAVVAAAGSTASPGEVLRKGRPLAKSPLRSRRRGPGGTQSPGRLATNDHAGTKELLFRCDAPAALHDAAAELRRAGYLITEQPYEVHGRWRLRAYSAASELMESDLSLLAEIAARCGVMFEGWGTHLGRDCPAPQRAIRRKTTSDGSRAQLVETARVAR